MHDIVERAARLGPGSESLAPRNCNPGGPEARFDPGPGSACASSGSFALSNVFTRFLSLRFFHLLSSPYFLSRARILVPLACSRRRHSLLGRSSRDLSRAFVVASPSFHPPMSEQKPPHLACAHLSHSSSCTWASPTVHCTIAMYCGFGSRASPLVIDRQSPRRPYL